MLFRSFRILKRHSGQHRQKLASPPWRASARGRFTWRVAQKFWAQWILERAGVSVRLIGKERVDWSRPHIVVANHQSTLDILLLVAFVPDGRYVAKKEVLSYPVIGPIARLGAQIIIDRKDHFQAMKAIREGMRDWSRCNLIFFAEGSRSPTGVLGEFKRGAFAIAKEMGLAIVPVAISGTYEALSKGSLLRLKRNPLVRVEFGHEIDPKTREVLQLTLLTRNKIFAMLQAPVR